MEAEQIEQEEFIDQLKTHMYEEQIAELEGITELSRVLTHKVNQKFNEGFTAISKHDNKFAMENPHLMKNFLKSSMMMVGFKIRERI